MKNLFKVSFKVISVLIIVFLVISILVATLVDINHYKDEISQFVETETGLKLEIHGDMKLSIISGVKFNVQDVSISNDKTLIADIRSLQLGVSLRSLYEGGPKITSVVLDVKKLNLASDKKGKYSFLPLLDSNLDRKHSDKKPSENINNSANEDFTLNHLSLNDVHLSIDQFTYQDKQLSQSFTLNDVSAFLSILPIIDHHELVIDDPRILVAYTYSGKLNVGKALINKYQITDLSLNFKDKLGAFVTEDLAFHFIQEGANHALPPLIMDAKGKLMLTISYHIPEGAKEPLWTQPELIKVGRFDFDLRSLKLSNAQFQAETKNAHLIFEEMAIFEAQKYVLNNLMIKSLSFNSNEVELNLENKNKYRLEKVLLQLKNLPLIKKGNLIKPDSIDFLKKFAQNGSIQFSSDTIVHKEQGLKNIKFHLNGKGKRINLSALSFNILDSDVVGEGYISIENKIPQWDFKIQSKKLNLKPLKDLLNSDYQVEGYANIQNHLSGTLQDSDFIIASGRVNVKANNLRISGVDLDKLVDDFQNSQSVGLLDIGAVALLGPAAIAVTKGNDYRNLVTSLDNKGNSEVTQLNSDISYVDDIATMEDVAFATKNHRLAMQGKINMKDNTFVKFDVATIDKDGCPIYKEELKGSLESPTVKKANVLISGVMNPINSVISQATKSLKAKCDKPFYQGIVKAPTK